MNEFQKIKAKRTMHTKTLFYLTIEKAVELINGFLIFKSN